MGTSRNSVNFTKTRAHRNALDVRESEMNNNQSVFKAPQEYPDDPSIPCIFLAGSIEMGAAVDWQTELTEFLGTTDLPHCILNPRRDDWDSSWEQSLDNEKFREQVEWELDGIENSDIVVFYFDPDTKSPITLLELGSVIDSGKDVIVYCPDGYWRKGNVDVVANKHGFEVFEDKEDFKQRIVRSIVSFFDQQ